MLTPVVELDARPGDEIGDGPRDKYLARSGKPGDSLGRVDGDTSDVAPQLDFSGMDPHSELDPFPAVGTAETLSTANGTGRTVEESEVTVAGGLDQSAAPFLRLSSSHLVQLVEKLSPPPVAHGAGLLGGPHDIGEDHGSEDEFPVPPSRCHSSMYALGDAETRASIGIV